MVLQPLPATELSRKWVPRRKFEIFMYSHTETSISAVTIFCTIYGHQLTTYSQYGLNYHMGHIFNSMDGQISSFFPLVQAMKK